MDTLLGLPGHPLLAHVAVTAIPIAAVLTVVIAAFPRVPALVKITTLALGTVALAVVPFMESSGKALEHKVTETPAVELHTEMGETLLPWAIGLFTIIVVILMADRWLRRPQSNGSGAESVPRRRTPMGRAVTSAVAITAAAVAAGTLVQTVRIGHSGAQATWSTHAPAVPAPGSGGAGEQEQGEH